MQNCKSRFIFIRLCLYTYMCIHINPRVHIFAQLVCWRQNDGMLVSKCSVFTRKVRQSAHAREEVIESMKESCNTYVNFFFHNVFFMNAYRYTDTYAAHYIFTYFIRNFLEENVRKKANYAWSVKWTHGRIWKKNYKRRWWFMRKIV